MRRLVVGIGVVDSDGGLPLVVNADSQGAMDLVKTPSISRRTKHIHVRFHFTRSAVADGTVSFQYCPTEKMIADMTTKPLARVKLERFVGMSGMVRN